jgi:ketosteroid isomerase-like protein
VTRDDLAVVSRMFACWGDDDLEGILSCVDPDIEWHSTIDSRPYRGHDGMREVFERWRAGGEQLEVPLQRAVEVAPGRVLAVGRVRVLRSGRGFADSPGIWLFHVERGRITQAETFRSEREARQAIRRSADGVTSGA